MLGQQHRRADGGGDVNIVAAGVHFAGSLGFVGNIVRFLDRQGVDVGADGDSFAGFCALQQGDDAGFGDVAPHFQAKAFQNVGDMGTGLDLFKPEFRVFMEVAPDADQFGQIFLAACFQCVYGNWRVGRMGVFHHWLNSFYHCLADCFRYSSEFSRQRRKNPPAVDSTRDEIKSSD